jgi:hypothetical protein
MRLLHRISVNPEVKSPPTLTTNQQKNFNLFWRCAVTTLPLPLLLSASRRRDLLLTSLIRSMDTYLQPTQPLIILLFVLSSTEIMTAWFHYPERLPPVYTHWITSFSELHPSILDFLRWKHKGWIQYGRYTGLGLEHHLESYCVKRGIRPSEGNPANGFLMCSKVVHPEMACAKHVAARWFRGFTKALGLYAAAYALPLIMKWVQHHRRSHKMKGAVASNQIKNESQTEAGKLRRLVTGYTISVARSSAFLATFIALTWTGICLTRNLIHEDVDMGPRLASFLSGWSILIEHPRRRGDVLMYVMPRAVYSWMYRNTLMKWLVSDDIRSLWKRVAEGALISGAVGYLMTVYLTDRHCLKPSLRILFRYLLDA